MSTSELKLVESVALSDGDEPFHVVALSPDGSLLAAAGGHIRQPGIVKILDRRTLAQVATFCVQQPVVTGLVFSPGGDLLAVSAKSTDRIELWRPAPVELAATLPLLSPGQRSIAGHRLTQTHVADMAFGDSGGALLAGSSDCVAKLFDLKSQARRDFARPHMHNVDFVAFLAERDRFVSGSYDRLFVWDIETARMINSLPLPPGDNWKHLAVNDGRGVFSISRRGRILLWNAETWSSEAFEVRLKPPVCALAHSSRLGIVAIGLESGTVLFWGLEQRRQIGRARLAKDPILSLAFAPLENAICSVAVAPSERLMWHAFRL